MSVKRLSVALSTSNRTSLSKFPFNQFLALITALTLCVGVPDLPSAIAQESNEDPAVAELLKNGLPDDLPTLSGKNSRPRNDRAKNKRSRSPKKKDQVRNQPNGEPGNNQNLAAVPRQPANNQPVSNAAEIKELLKGLPDTVPLSARKKLERNIIPALLNSNDMAFIHAVADLVSDYPPEMVGEIEEYCESKQLGSLKQQFTEKLIAAVMQGMRSDARKFSPELVDFASSGMLDVVESELQDFKIHRINDDPLTLPSDWAKNEKLFWDAHVWRNRFQNIKQLVEFAKLIQAPLLKKAVELDHDDKIDRYRKPFFVEKTVQSQYQNLLEREAELRLLALSQAEEILRTSDDNFERLNAAFALEMHGGELDLFFREHEGKELEREKLNEADIGEKCGALVASGRKHGKKIIEKAMLLRIGAHWWFRGRYGKSTMVGGLLKPPAAMQKEAAMFGLFMPKDRPNAIGYVDSESGEETQGYDRRHHYTWGVERQEVTRSVRTNTNEQGTGPRRYDGSTGVNSFY